jgi:hypothetical protein
LAENGRLAGGWLFSQSSSHVRNRRARDTRSGFLLQQIARLEISSVKILTYFSSLFTSYLPESEQNAIVSYTQYNLSSILQIFLHERCFLTTTVLGTCLLWPLYADLEIMREACTSRPGESSRRRCTLQVREELLHDTLVWYIAYPLPPLLASLFMSIASWSIQCGRGCVGGSGRARRQDVHDYTVRTRIDHARR